MKSRINEHLIALHAKHGTLTSGIVIEDARRKDSPLHDLFEWDVEKAAVAHWHETARALIRSVKVVITNDTRVLTAPYFVRDPSLPSDVQGYTTITALRSDADLARDAVAEECARAAAAFRRAQDVADAVGVESDVGALLEATLSLERRMKEPKVA